MAIELYDKTIFHGATFADMKHAGGPFVIIKASDLAYGVRFSFIKEYFNQIPTTFSLSDEQIDRLIFVGPQLLRKNSDYQRLLTNLGGAR